jgi:hypothetical protein
VHPVLSVGPAECYQPIYLLQHTGPQTEGRMGGITLERLAWGILFTGGISLYYILEELRKILKMLEHIAGRRYDEI